MICLMSYIFKTQQEPEIQSHVGIFLISLNISPYPDMLLTFLLIFKNLMDFILIKSLTNFMSSQNRTHIHTRICPSVLQELAENLEQTFAKFMRQDYFNFNLHEITCPAIDGKHIQYSWNFAVAVLSTITVYGVSRHEQP